MSNLLNRRNTSTDISSTICQGCKRFEIDLATATDNLSATDAELKASRQVISLLQRQLELFQVEKEGLERLVVSQSKSGPSLLDQTNNDDNKTLIATIDKDLIASGEQLLVSDDSFRNSSPDEVQRKLLKLIKMQLYSKDEEIVKLKSALKESQNEKEQLNLQLHTLEDDISKLRAENALLKENLALRDQTIVSLSNEVFEQSQTLDHAPNQRRQSSAEVLSYHLETRNQQKKIIKLNDTLEAYKKTNELLSSNVIRLTEKCAQSERKEVEARSQCDELEAKCCQIQSKLLSLLKEIEQSSKHLSNNPDSDDNNQTREREILQSESVKSLIKRLLEDKSLDIPLSWKEGNGRKKDNFLMGKDLRSKHVECDELGFYVTVYDLSPEKTTSDSLMGTSSTRSHSRNSKRGFNDAAGWSSYSASSVFNPRLDTVGEENLNAENDSNNLEFGERPSSAHYESSIDSGKKDEARWRSKWDNFIKDFDNIDLAKSKEFKLLLRNGVPQDYRCKVWKAIINLKIGRERLKYGPDYYQSLLEPTKFKQSNFGASNSHNITKNPSSKQIELDLLRTLPNNKYFETIDSVGTVRLRRVLLAFSTHRPEVGYCQGMNRLAAVALLVLPEEEAFWCLVAIVDKIMPVGYYNDLWLAQVDSNVVMDLVATKMPKLSEHFRRNDIELSLFAWFLTIFVDGTTPALFLRLWDSFLYEGDKILFRVALALLKKYESELLRINSSVSTNNYLRSAISASMDIDQLFEIAFEGINPLSGRSLRINRQQNFEAMKSSLRGSGVQNQCKPADDHSNVSKNSCNEYCDASDQVIEEDKRTV